MNATQSTPAAEPKPKLAETRHADGQVAQVAQCAPGHPSGPGIWLARKVAALRKALVEAVTEEDIREIARVLIEKAKEGSTAAIKLIFQYALGKPGPENDPDRLDIYTRQPGATASATGKSAAPTGGFPSGLVDRMALAGLGTAQVPVSIAGPSPNGGNGGRGGEGKESRR
jgi:hypothetical protein